MSQGAMFGSVATATREIVHRVIPPLRVTFQFQFV